jgi:hypothetical protein
VEASRVKRMLDLESVVARHVKKWLGSVTNWLDNVTKGLGNVMMRFDNKTKRLDNVIETSVPERVAARNETRTAIAAVLLIHEARLLCHYQISRCAAGT